MNQPYHVPVLGQQTAGLIITNQQGIYVDGTLGGGGHASLILTKIDQSAKYIGIDRDSEAMRFAKNRLKNFTNISFHQARFAEFEEVLNDEGIDQIDGLLLDLGISSKQIDDDQRGFTFRANAKLDMRMNNDDDLTAEMVLNNYSEADLKRIFKEYGEERFSGRIARSIVEARQKYPITKSEQLLKIIDRHVQQRFSVKSYARIFQALRIEVNDELGQLENALQSAAQRLKKGGRLAVISYHSLEDGRVKSFIRQKENPCTCPEELPYCICGKIAEFKRIRPYPLVPDSKEIKQNPRSRSAKLRVSERI